MGEWWFMYIGDGPQGPEAAHREGSWHCTTRRDSAFVQDGKADSQQGPR